MTTEETTQTQESVKEQEMTEQETTMTETIKQQADDEITRSPENIQNRIQEATLATVSCLQERMGKLVGRVGERRKELRENWLSEFASKKSKAQEFLQTIQTKYNYEKLLAKINIPTKVQLDELAERVDSLTESIEKLTENLCPTSEANPQATS